MADFTLASLRAKRRRIHAQLRKLEPLAAGYYAKLAEVNAAIQAIGPQLWMQPRRTSATRYSPATSCPGGRWP